MTSKITISVNGNYRVPVYKGTAFQDMGTPEYVGPGNWGAPLHTLKPGEFYFVGAEEAYDPEAEAKKAAAELENQDKTEEA